MTSTSTAQPPTAASAATALVVEGLEYAYPSGWRLRLPQLSLAEGEQILLTGGSGSGKSTLLHLVAGLVSPDGGRIVVAGTDLRSLRGSALDTFRGRNIGMIFQTFHLLEGFSALENVLAALMFGDAPASKAGGHRARAAELLASLGIDRPNAMPSALSVGQQQRVAVARAVACRPRLVLADEPTASLDPAAAAVAMTVIQDACRACGAALLCTSHDPAMRERFARQLSLDTPPG